ncbi:MAG: response regulator [Desulfobacterales bacterium]|nr:response regulator [Desulfobacterales bacterium]
MPKKILIVDDEIYIRTLLEQTLEELEEDHDIMILSASNGEEGLEIIRKEKPELVFLDIMMPKINGYEVCREITNDDSLKDVTIILLTAKGQEVDRNLGMSAGALVYMTKPFDPDQILDLSKKLLGLK